MCITDASLASNCAILRCSEPTVRISNVQRRIFVPSSTAKILAMENSPTRITLLFSEELLRCLLYIPEISWVRLDLLGQR